MRMDCYAIEPLAGSKDVLGLESQALSKEKRVENFIKGLRDGIKGLAESVGIPTPDTQQAKEGNDVPAIEPSDLIDANSIDASDLSIAQGCAGTAYYVSKQPIARSISDRKCWRKLSVQQCPVGKELMLVKGLLYCLGRTVLKEEATRDLVCFE